MARTSHTTLLASFTLINLKVLSKHINCWNIEIIQFHNTLGTPLDHTHIIMLMLLKSTESRQTLSPLYVAKLLGSYFLTLGHMLSKNFEKGSESISNFVLVHNFHKHE